MDNKTKKLRWKILKTADHSLNDDGSGRKYLIEINLDLELKM